MRLMPSGYRGGAARAVQLVLHALPLLAIAVLWPARTRAMFLDELAGSGIRPSSLMWDWLVSALTAFGPAVLAAPTVAAAAGLCAGLLALAVAQATAATSWERVRATDVRWPALLVPAASYLVVGLPAFHVVLTDGSDAGLLLLWIAAATWAAATADAPGGRTWRAVLVGFGPLVRPECLLLAAPLLVAIAAAAASDRERLSIVGAALAPIGVELFVMGGDSALLGNIVPATRAFRTSQWLGLGYVRPILEPRWLLVPLAPVLVMAVRLTMRSVPDLARRAALASLVGGAMMAIWVTRIGGDQDPRTLLLGALFALIIPAAMWPITPPRRSAAFGLVAQTVLLLLLPLWAL